MLKKNKDRSRSLNEELNPTDTTSFEQFVCVCGGDYQHYSQINQHFQPNIWYLLKNHYVK